MHRTATALLLILLTGSSCVAAGLAHASMAIPRTCAVSGTVRDKTGAVIPNATVKVIESGTGISHDFTADSAGHYCAFGLPAENYSITVDRPGFRSTHLDAISVSPNRVVEADVVLPSLPPEPEAPRSPAITSHPVHPVTPAPQPSPPPPAPPQAARPVSSANSGATPSASSNSTSSDDLGEAEAKWFDQLKNGSIQYQVPVEMVIGQPSTVSVTVNGYKAPAPADQPDSSKPATLKVSEFMRVEVSQVDNPGEFTIVHGDNPDQQFVPINSSATWTWTVTPNHLGKSEKLQFQAFVVYSDPKLNVQQALASTEKTVTVRAEGVTGIARNAEDNFWLNPANWIKYMLPGGGGFVLLGLLIGWLRSKRKKTDAGKPAPK